MIMFYVANMEPLLEEKLYNKAYGLVSAERQQKADRLTKQHGKSLTVAAELLLRYGLLKAGCDVEQLSFAYGANGKPYLLNCPEVKFNLSHSGSMVVCAISDKEVGCDIEQIKAGRIELAKRFFHSSETAAILELTEEVERTDAFYRFWTLKEAFMKFTGLGFALPLGAFAIKLGQPSFLDEESLEGYLSEHPEASEVLLKLKVGFKEYSFENYACALCCQENDSEEIRCSQVGIEVILAELLSF